MFEYLNAILYKSNKNGNILTSVEESKDFQPFLMQRWCSMYSTSIAHIVNETTNRYWSTLEGNTMWYSAMDTIIPKCSFKKISYIKKNKKEANAKETEYIQKIANSLEISSRELINYIRENNLEIKLPKTND